MKNKLSKYTLMEKLADEKFKHKTVVLAKHKSDYDKCKSHGECIKKDIVKYSKDHNLKISANDLTACGIYKQHIMMLLDKNNANEIKLLNLQSVINVVQDECSVLKVEANKYNLLKENLADMIYAADVKKDAKQLDELWLIGRRNRRATS